MDREARSSGLPIGRIGDETELGEERDDAVFIGGGSGRGGIVGSKDCLRFFAGDGAPPQFLAGFRVETDCQQFIRFAGGEVDASARKDGGGLAVRNRRFPDDVFCGREFDGVSCRGVDAGAVRPPELGPLIGCGSRQAKKQKCT
jgi:hypothetical protein